MDHLLHFFKQNERFHTFSLKKINKGGLPSILAETTSPFTPQSIEWISSLISTRTSRLT